MTPRYRPTGLAVLALSLSLTLAACAREDDPAGPGPRPTPTEPPAPASRGIDARAYVDDYASNVYEDSTAFSSGAPRSNGVAGSAAAPSGTAEYDGGGIDLPDPPEPDEDNTFVEAGTSGFVDTAADALSTFALDVDTGSLGVARSLLTSRHAVPPASIRPEEWINALPYDDPAPTDADLGLTTDSGLAPTLTDGTQLVRVGVGARVVDPATRPRVNVTLVVDRSGSMDIRERLGLVQSSLALLADRLNDDDTVSVVSFEDQAKPILEPTPVSDTDAILDAVEKLEPGGSTNLEAGLRLGYDQARDAFDPDAVNLVVLCSDGVANVGATGPDSITSRIAEEGADGIHLVTVGFGMGNYNDHLMEQLADLGDGFYSYVDSFREAEQLFGTDLTTTLVPVAGEARTQVAFDPAVVASYRLIGYDNREIADEEYVEMDVDAGELGSGHHATALYEVRLADGVEPGTVIGAASVRWLTTGGDRDGATEEASIDLVAADPDATPSDDLLLAGAAADLAQVLKARAPYPDRGATLADVTARIAELDDRDVAGADELLDLATLAARR